MRTRQWLQKRAVDGAGRVDRRLRDEEQIEYTDDARSAYTDACAARGTSISVILRDRDVVVKGQSAYRYEHC